MGKNVVFDVSAKVSVAGFDWSPVAGNVVLDSSGRWSWRLGDSHFRSMSSMFTVTAGSTLNPILWLRSTSQVLTGANHLEECPRVHVQQAGGNDGVMLVSGENTANLNFMQLTVQGTPTSTARSGQMIPVS